MGYREFADDDGLQWKVWDVRPSPRTVANANLYPPEAVPAHVSPGWAQGWLAFQSEHLTKRLKPIPTDWESASETGLKSYLHEAVEAKTRHAS
jgi:hypothetical protein